MSEPLIGAAFALYWLAVGGLFVYGANCYVLIGSFLRGRARRGVALEARREAFWARAGAGAVPTVTVQLPIYNERFVVARLIDAVARLDYPRDRLEIQVLDDSSDDTADIVRALVRRHARRGVRIDHVRRRGRAGYKAGALAHGLSRARGALVAVFDADFVPRPDFLRRVVPSFEDPGLGAVQARWSHLNRDRSPLTRAQALAIDGHFGVEQPGRCWAGWLLSFNGTAGVWRRRAIESAGGWQADTLTEDLDLSYRAQLAGWRIDYLPDVDVPAELPTELSAFKSQQRRWAKGSIQTARKLAGRVLRSDRSLPAKAQALLHLTHYSVHPLMLLVALLAPPLLAYWEGPWAPFSYGVTLALLGAGLLGPSALYATGQRSLGGRWRHRLVWAPALLLLGTGIAAANTRAVLEALFGVPSGFVRTPKRGSSAGEGRAREGRVATRPDPQRAPGPRDRYRLSGDGMLPVELALAGYCAWGAFAYAHAGKYLIGPFLALYALSFAGVAVASLLEAATHRRRGRAARARRRAAVAEPGDEPAEEGRAASGVAS